MAQKMKGVYEFIFIRGGISSKSNKPYLSVSNGRAELFVQIPKSLSNSDFEEMFATFNEGDTINLEVSILPGSENVELHSVVE